MDIYKEFLYQIRKISFIDTYLKIHGDVTPKLKNYIKLLDNVKFEDGSYHTYYGEIKKIINSFITCWTKTMDEAIKVSDRYTHDISRDDLIDLMETTINLNKTKQIDFARDFLPVKSRLEQEMYENVEEQFDEFMDRLYQLRDQIERLDKQDKVDLFAIEHFPTSLKKKNEVFLFTHTYISILLINHVDQIRVSLEEIELRARNNVHELQEQCTTSINSLLNQLYDKNKEHLSIFRQDTRSSLEIAEVQRSMEIIKDKIEDSHNVPIARMKEEHKYWQDRKEEFNHIFNALQKLNEAEKQLLEEEQMLNSIQCPEKFKPESICWGETSKRLQYNMQTVKELKTKTGKALVTFFSVRGPDHVIYADNIGPYYVDDYGHKVYFFDYGLKLFHVDCDGNFVQANENEKYYYDQMGRYLIGPDGSKNYQVAPCTSTYNLHNDIFVKQTKDCGHSNKDVNGCRMKIKDPNDLSILPLVEAVDLGGKVFIADDTKLHSLDPDASTYLWESFGHILSYALRDVAIARPKNPVHYLAHKLLFHKYSRPKLELRTLKEEAVKYRTKLFQDSKDRQTAASKAWKAKQVKHRKPEESDDALERFAYDTHIAKQQFIKTLNNFDD